MEQVAKVFPYGHLTLAPIPTTSHTRTLATIIRPMTEPQIRDYLLEKLPASELEEADKETGKRIRPYYQEVEMIDKGKFFIELRHLIYVCNDVLNGRMKPETLDLFSFIIIGSDYFTWECESEDGHKISEVIFEWNNPAINYPLTVENVREWKNYLQGHGRQMRTDYGRQHSV